MIGPGKYDDVATAALQASQARDGVILIVLNGSKGSGFAAQLSPDVFARLQTRLKLIGRGQKTSRRKRVLRPGSEVGHPVQPQDG